MPSIAERRKEFRRLHESGCFILPNPWDIGTARYLQTLGFKALATTSAGFAFAQGYPDNRITREMALDHCAEIVEATDLPINADFEGGFAHEPEGVAESVRLCAQTGVAGLSIEDSTGDAANPLYDFDLAVARVRAARQALDKAAPDLLFTARHEGFLVGKPDIGEAVRRLKAFSDAGADCLYAPGLRTREHIKAVIDAVAPKPVNIIIAWKTDLTLKDLTALGARRISTGSAPARVAWGAFMRSSKELAERGTFDLFADAAVSPELNKLFGEDLKKRGIS
jgi:2-methylisocitrate lyase-like PEP mutase family enzyme